MSILVNNVIHPASAPNFSANTYTQVYASSAASPTINGVVVSMAAGSTINIIVKSISATANVFVIGTHRIIAPTVING